MSFIRGKDHNRELHKNCLDKAKLLNCEVVKKLVKAGLNIIENACIKWRNETNIRSWMWFEYSMGKKLLKRKETSWLRLYNYIGPARVVGSNQF
jgi:hypothetical protein